VKRSWHAPLGNAKNKRGGYVRQFVAFLKRPHGEWMFSETEQQKKALSIENGQYRGSQGWNRTCGQFALNAYFGKKSFERSEIYHSSEIVETAQDKIAPRGW